MVRHIDQEYRSPVQNIAQNLRKGVVRWFTLIEILIVTSVIWVLASATTSRISNQQEAARNVARKTMVWQTASAVTTFFSNNRYWPNNLNSIKNYLKTPTDPKKLDTCNLGATANGELWYATYINWWLTQDQDGFMVFAQLERGGQGIEHKNIYLLTGSNPCQDSALGGGRVDRYRIANSVCTSKPWWTDNNPSRATAPIALSQTKQDIADIFGNQKTYAAAFIGTGARTKPWIGTWSNDFDGDQVVNASEPNTAARTNPCIPSQFARNCDTDTDEDTIYDPLEWNNSDTDSDGMPDYMESATQDRDGDSMWDQYDNERPTCNGQAATIYISPTLVGANRVIYVNGWGSNLSTYNGTLNVWNGGQVVVLTNGNDNLTVWNGDYTICLRDWSNTIKAWNGDVILVWWNGVDYIDELWNGRHAVSLWGGNDNIRQIWNGNNGSNPGRPYSSTQVIDCWAWTDTVGQIWNGSKSCNGCESGCGNVWSTAAFTWVTYPPSANTATCNAGVATTSLDPDADSYMNATWAQANYGNADSDGTNPCKPNSRANNCSQKASIQAQFPQWACFDNDYDGYHNNIYHSTYIPVNVALSWTSRDPQDQDPCIPDSGSTACITFNNIDADGDGYRPNGVGGFDPDDTKPCIPQAFWAWCTRDSDGDTKTDYQEWEFVNTDSFLGYSDTLANSLYAITGYSTILGWPTELASGDSFYNRQESDRLLSSTWVALGADPDGDWYTNELDPANNIACIPDNFASGCTLDFDQDGKPDRQETSWANTDTTWWFISDAYPNWIESLFTNTLNYLWLLNPAWANGDPDWDWVANEIDPDNGNRCVPNTGFDTSCFPVVPPPPPPTGITWIDCAAMSSLPYGAKAYYVLIY
jgi:type II secretory pathway pseudopilin PulG